MADSLNAYVAHRAVLLANLVLTRREDVQVLSFGEKGDVGVDLILRIQHPVMNGQVLPMLGVQVKGTSRPITDGTSATRAGNTVWKNRPVKGLFLFPIVMLFFSMEGDQGYWSWLMEPRVTEKSGPSLERVSNVEMKKITKESIDNIITSVIHWFDAMGAIMSKDTSSK